MPIPESQLSRWAHHGAQQAPIQTHEAIHRVLDAHTWPQGVTYDFYLQGSYKNHTNIRGDSDVDVVLELTSTFCYDVSMLPSFDQQRLTSSIQQATYGWNDFRRETLKALRNGFGESTVVQGNKSIKVKTAPPRLAADVVVCMEHRTYQSLYSCLEGIAFQSLRDKHWITNYPKQHYKNGADKNQRTWNRYKPTVRMFKNVRNNLEAQKMIKKDSIPSYFVECLLYNVPDFAFQPTFQQTYSSILYYMNDWMTNSGFDRLTCQNGHHLLFGPSPSQWSIEEAEDFTLQLAALWGNSG